MVRQHVFHVSHRVEAVEDGPSGPPRASPPCRYSALADREHAGIFYHFDLADRTFRRIVRHGDVPVLEKEEVMAHLVEAVGDGAVLGRPVLSAVFCGQLKIPVDERLHLRLSSLPPLLRGEGLQPPFGSEGLLQKRDELLHLEEVPVLPRILGIGRKEAYERALEMRVAVGEMTEPA